MNATDFQTAAIALLRSAVGWQTTIAHRLGVEPRTVRRWIKADEVPGWVDAKFDDWTRARDLAPWPRDEWLNGDAISADGRQREYIAHLQEPRFVARIVACDDDGLPMPEEEPADVLSGIVYSVDAETLLCEIEWIDEVRSGEHAKWLEAAADAIAALGDSYKEATRET